MPFPTIPAHRRRKHQRSSRHRRNVSSPHTNRSLRRHQLRDQKSADVEACYDLRLKRGLHLDPDVRIGAAVGFSNNRFSVFETVETSRSPSIVPPFECDFTFSNPVSEPDLQACLAIDELSHPDSSQSAEVNGLWRQSTFPDAALDLTLPSVPTTPPSAPKCRLPASHTSELDEADVKPMPPSLHNFTIPSPLLYHRKSRAELFGQDGDNNNLSNDIFPLIHGQDPPDPDFESFKLGSPLHAPRRVRESQSFNKVDFIGRNEEPASSLDDVAFYQHRRTYLSSSPERNGKCGVTLKPQIEQPSVTTTNTLRNRETHIYPGEFVLTPPATPPLASWTTARSVPGISEHNSFTTATVVNEYRPRGFEGRTRTIADPASPSQRQYSLSSPAPSVGTINEYTGDLRRSSKTVPCSAIVHEESGNGAHIPPASDNHLLSGRDQIGAGSPEIRPFPELHSPRKETEKSPNRDFDSNRRSFSLSRPTQPLEADDLLSTRTAAAVSNAASRAAATTPSLPLTTPPQPPTITLPPPSTDLDLVDIKPCPTPSCAALLLLVPASPEGIDDDGVVLLSEERYADEKGVSHSEEVGKMAGELGFEIQHSDGCVFVGGVGEGERGNEGLQGQEGDWERGSFGTAADWGNADDDGWVGEDEGLEFWV